MRAKGAWAAVWRRLVAGGPLDVGTYRLDLVDVPGQPGLSTGWAPPFTGDGYDLWIEQLVDGLIFAFQEQTDEALEPPEPPLLALATSSGTSVSASDSDAAKHPSSSVTHPPGGIRHLPHHTGRTYCENIYIYIYIKAV